MCLLGTTLRTLPIWRNVLTSCLATQREYATELILCMPCGLTKWISPLENCQVNRFDKQARIEALSRNTKLHESERVNCAVGEPEEALYKQARYIFARTFSNYREKFGQDYVPDLLLGGVQEKMCVFPQINQCCS